MRVKRAVYIPSVISLENILYFDESLGLTAPEPPEEPDAVIGTDIFSKLNAGDERVCVVLRADGLTYAAIGEIMGKSEAQVKNIIYSIRKRLIEEKEHRKEPPTLSAVI